MSQYLALSARRSTILRRSCEVIDLHSLSAISCKSCRHLSRASLSGMPSKLTLASLLSIFFTSAHGSPPGQMGPSPSVAAHCRSSLNCRRMA